MWHQRCLFKAFSKKEITIGILISGPEKTGKFRWTLEIQLGFKRLMQLTH